jgi:cytochrome c oxidase subunit 1
MARAIRHSDYAITAAYLLWSLRYGQAAGSNPWRAAGLEWKTESPPVAENFAETPVVAEEPYDYERNPS